MDTTEFNGETVNIVTKKCIGKILSIKLTVNYNSVVRNWIN